MSINQERRGEYKLFHLAFIDNPIVRIKQNGNLISGTFGESISGVFHGYFEGGIAKIEWTTTKGKGHAKWKISENGGKLNGTFSSNNSGDRGKWNLTKIK